MARWFQKAVGRTGTAVGYASIRVALGLEQIRWRVALVWDVVVTLPVIAARVWPLLVAASRDVHKAPDLLQLDLLALRQERAVLLSRSKVVRPDRSDRFLLGLIARIHPCWRQRGVLGIVRPETILRYSRAGFRVLRRSGLQPGARRHRLPAIARALVHDMARRNELWGTRRIVGELVQLGVSIHRRTVQRILRERWPQGRPRDGQSWATFFANMLGAAWVRRLRPLLAELDARARARLQAIAAWLTPAPRPVPPAGGGRRRPAGDGRWARLLRERAPWTWACDYFDVVTALATRLTVFFLIKHDTREIVHWAVTRHPNAEWTAKQLETALALRSDAPPRFVIRDRDSKFGSAFDRVARAHGIRVCRTPVRAPRANAIAERVVGTCRREALDHVLFLDQAHLERVLGEYVGYYQHSRPHQSLGQRPPCSRRPSPPSRPPRVVVREPVLGGLHHVYRAVA